MYYALNGQDVRTHISKAITSAHYRCPICSQPVVQKRGALNAHHFAHVSGQACDPWYTDMSLWHRQWQLAFPEEFREKSILISRQQHIADICIGNVVIEFQHSSISISEFQSRSRFYTFGQRKLIWVIDCLEDYAAGRILQGSTSPLDGATYFRWLQPKRFLTGILPRGEHGIEIFLQLTDSLHLQVRDIEKNFSNQCTYGTFWAKAGEVHNFFGYIDSLVDPVWRARSAADAHEEYLTLLTPFPPDQPFE